MSTMPLKSDEPSTRSPSARRDSRRGAVGHRERELFELAVDGQVMEGDALDLFRLDDLEEIRPGEVRGRLVEEEGQGVGQGVSGSLHRHDVGLLVG